MANTNPNLAFSEHILTSIGSVIVTPTPTAAPFIAAINGFLKSNNLKVSIPPVSLLTSVLALPLSDISKVSSPEDRSAPAQKAFPEPVKITARMSSSFSVSSRSSKISFNICPEKVFIFSGLLKTTVKTLFFVEVFKLSKSFIFFSLF